MERWFYITTSTAFFIALGASLALLLSYSGIPFWIWAFYAVAILIFIFGIFVKEIFLKEHTDPVTGLVTNQSSLNTWKTIYGIGYGLGVLLFFSGVIVTITYSTTIPAWVWIVMGVSVALFVIGNAVNGIWPDAKIWSTIINVLGVITFVIFIFGMMLAINAPWWIWLMMLITIGLGLVAHIAEVNSRPNNKMITPPTSPYSSSSMPTSPYSPYSVPNSMQPTPLPTSYSSSVHIETTPTQSFSSFNQSYQLFPYNTSTHDLFAKPSGDLINLNGNNISFVRPDGNVV